MTLCTVISDLLSISTLKMEAGSSTIIFVLIYDATYWHNPDDQSLNWHHCIKLKSRKFILILACKGKGKGKVHPCTGTEALYRPYSP